jgi:hypothetical protein
MVPSAQGTNVPQLHKFLGLGVTSILLMFTFLTWLGIAPLLRDDGGAARTIAYATAGVAAVIAGVVLLVLKPKVPERAPGQSVAQYWAAPASAQKVLLVWFLLEGGAVLAAIGFVLSGETIAAVVAAITVVVFWMNGPHVFAKP